jgi:hypothetical protein
MGELSLRALSSLFHRSLRLGRYLWFMEARYVQRTRNKRRRSVRASAMPVRDSRRSARAALGRRIDALVAEIERVPAR